MITESNLSEQVAKMMEFVNPPPVTVPISDFLKDVRDRKNRINGIRNQLANIEQLKAYLSVQLDFEEAAFTSLLNSMNVTSDNNEHS